MCGSSIHEKMGIGFKISTTTYRWVKQSLCVSPNQLLAHRTNLCCTLQPILALTPCSQKLLCNSFSFWPNERAFHTKTDRLNINYSDILLYLKCFCMMSYGHQNLKRSKHFLASGFPEILCRGNTAFVCSADLFYYLSIHHLGIFWDSLDEFETSRHILVARFCHVCKFHSNFFNAVLFYINCTHF